MIENVAIIGLGALGINFANFLNQKLGSSHVRIVADVQRIKRYQTEGVFYNHQACAFNYVRDDERMQPADLVLFCTKFNGLQDAIASMKYQIDEHTLIMSAINGISSEEVLQAAFPKNRIIYTVAQGMDATKVGNNVNCMNIGELCFGDFGGQADCVADIEQFFTSLSFPHTVKKDILHHQWGKFMLNVGLNQVLAIHEGSYECVQEEGEIRDEMIRAMREVILISKYTGVNLQEQELQEWLHLCDHLAATGKPSMAQDVDAKRKSEVELFSGTMIKLAKKYGVSVPENERLYKQICELETQYT